MLLQRLVYPSIVLSYYCLTHVAHYYESFPSRCTRKGKLLYTVKKSVELLYTVKKSVKLLYTVKKSVKLLYTVKKSV